LMARMQILPNAYLCDTPLHTSIQQTVVLPARTAAVVVSGWSRVEQLYFGAHGLDSIDITISAVASFGGAIIVQGLEHFALHELDWQLRQFTLCFNSTEPLTLTVVCSFQAHRGAVYFDDIRAIPIAFPDAAFTYNQIT